MMLLKCHSILEDGMVPQIYFSDEDICNMLICSIIQLEKRLN